MCGGAGRGPDGTHGVRPTPTSNLLGLNGASPLRAMLPEGTITKASATLPGPHLTRLHSVFPEQWGQPASSSPPKAQGTRESIPHPTLGRGPGEGRITPTLTPGPRTGLGPFPLAVELGQWEPRQWEPLSPGIPPLTSGGLGRFSAPTVLQGLSRHLA